MNWCKKFCSNWILLMLYKSYIFSYFLDINKTFGFLFAYIMSCISTFTVGMTVATMDSLYVGLTVYLAAMFQDLHFSIGDLETNFRYMLRLVYLFIKKNAFNRINEMGKESVLLFRRKKLLKKFRINLIRCVRFHTRILRCRFLFR